MHILLLEDDEDMLLTLGEALEMEGHTVTYGRSGTDGLSLLSQTLPELVISDLRMPDMDGLGFIREVRQQVRWAKLPIIIMSGSASDQDRALEAGASDFLVKPFHFPELESALERIRMSNV